MTITTRNLTAANINVEIENDCHAHMVELQGRIRFLLGVAIANNVKGEGNLLELMYEGLTDWNDVDDDGSYGFQIHKGGHHVAVCDGNTRHVLLTITK